MDEYQIPYVYDTATAVAKDKDRVLTVEGIRKEQKTPYYAHVPEVYRDDTLTCLL